MNKGIHVDHQDLKIKLGDSIIIPLNTWHCFKASKSFKMIRTMIKASA
jgi:mannose-6-phosphate isomerase-like protein (cupin superfamily)